MLNSFSERIRDYLSGKEVRERLSFGVILSVLSFFVFLNVFSCFRPAPVVRIEPLAATASPNQISALGVHIEGAISKPGYYELKSGSRVIDLVNVAGGLTKNADPNSINLAATISDGEKISVADKPLGVVALKSSKSKITSATGSNNKLSLNAASVEQLDLLPKIGLKTAEAIVQYRKRIGKFRNLEQLLEVKRIGPNTLEAIRPFLRL